MLEDHDKINHDIQAWDRGTKNDLVARMNSLNIRHVKRSPNKISLQRALKSSLRKRGGLVNRISYQMPRSAIFLHKGVGKGRPASAPRGAKEWYSPVVNKNITGLADIVAEGGANMIVNNLDIK